MQFLKKYVFKKYALVAYALSASSYCIAVSDQETKTTSVEHEKSIRREERKSSLDRPAFEELDETEFLDDELGLTDQGPSNLTTQSKSTLEFVSGSEPSGIPSATSLKVEKSGTQIPLPARSLSLWARFLTFLSSIFSRSRNKTKSIPPLAIAEHRAQTESKAAEQRSSLVKPSTPQIENAKNKLETISTDVKKSVDYIGQPDAASKTALTNFIAPLENLVTLQGQIKNNAVLAVNSELFDGQTQSAIALGSALEYFKSKWPEENIYQTVSLETGQEASAGQLFDRVRDNALNSALAKQAQERLVQEFLTQPATT